MSKFCGGCKKTLDLTQFYNNKRKRDGKQTQCKPCMKKQNVINYKKHKKQWNERSVEYRKTDKWKKYKNNYECNKYKNNSSHRIHVRLRTNLREKLKSCKSKSTMKYVGCNVERLKCHLESQFGEFMSWRQVHLFHIDHRIPCAAFDMENELDKRVCWWYKNLQPMWAKENIKKNAKYKEEDKQALIKEWIFYHI